MAVTAYLEAARVLRAESPRAFALQTLNRILAEAWNGAESLQHVIAYGESDSETPRGEGLRHSRRLRHDGARLY